MMNLLVVKILIHDHIDLLVIEFTCNSRKRLIYDHEKSVPIYLCGHDLLFGRTMSEGIDN